MSHIQLDYSKLAPFVADHELEYMQTQVTAVDKALREGISSHWYRWFIFRCPCSN